MPVKIITRGRAETKFFYCTLALKCLSTQKTLIIPLTYSTVRWVEFQVAEESASKG